MALILRVRAAVVFLYSILSHALDSINGHGICSEWLAPVQRRAIRARVEGGTDGLMADMERQYHSMLASTAPHWLRQQCRKAPILKNLSKPLLWKLSGFSTMVHSRFSMLRTWIWNETSFKRQVQIAFCNRLKSWSVIKGEQSLNQKQTRERIDKWSKLRNILY